MSLDVEAVGFNAEARSGGDSAEFLGESVQGDSSRAWHEKAEYECRNSVEVGQALSPANRVARTMVEGFILTVSLPRPLHRAEANLASGRLHPAGSAAGGHERASTPAQHQCVC